MWDFCRPSSPRWMKSTTSWIMSWLLVSWMDMEPRFSTIYLHILNKHSVTRDSLNMNQPSDKPDLICVYIWDIYIYTCCSCLLIIIVSYPALALRFVAEAADKMKKATFVCRPQWLFIFASIVTRAFGTSHCQSFLSGLQTPNVPLSLAGAAPLVPWRWRPGTLAAKFWSLQCGVHGWKNKAR